ncbi:MAG: HupU protein, partial [Candidatus Sedimenticola sp. 20ELBAFRAG]
MSNSRNLLWLQSGGCGGCSLSLFNAESPDLLTSLESAGINLLWHPSIAEQSGNELLELLESIRKDEVPLDLLCLEG